MKDRYTARGWKRKKWDLRKDLTFDVINQMTQHALDLLTLRVFDLTDLPALYKANQLIHKVVEEETAEAEFQNSRNGWDIDKKLPGVFTTRQCRSMVVATKGSAPKPADFKLDSIVHEHEIEKSAQKPQYYAERIQLMYSGYPVLEIHDTKFKYIGNNYLIDEIKGEANGKK